MCGLYEYIEREKITTPIKLQLVLHKVVHKSDGNDVRYFRVKIEGKDVTQMVADTADLKVSTGKDTNGCLIIRGSNMDMGFALQNRVYLRARNAGFPDMFSYTDYIYLGRK